MNVGQKERITQDRIVKLLRESLGYHYLGNWHDRESNSNIEKDLLRSFLINKQGYSPDLINRALFELEKTATNQTKSLYDVNKDVYSLLRYGVKVKETIGDNTQTVQLIDWGTPMYYDFAVAEEVTI